MKHFGLAALALSFMLFVAAGAQAQTDTPTLPDLTGQEKSTSEVSVVLDGRMTTLNVEVWYFVDWQNLKRHWVNVFNNEAGGPWLALYQVEIGEKTPDGGVRTKETHMYLFENVGGKWILVQDHSASQDVDKELKELLKNRYKLEYH